MSASGKYKDTLNLPETEFAMRGKLAVREPELLAEWKSTGLYEKIQTLRADSPRYILHDGPPYSNGHIHYGHVLNKILKDLVVKYRTMAGYLSPYIPGWDTHGLPIELEVERELAKQGKTTGRNAAEVRTACREHALRFVDVQKKEFERLGVFGTWDDPYLTLHKSYEASIVRALAAFARGGYLYRGKKPVYWCPNDRTALAEAEIEYANHTSPSIYVRFPMVDFDSSALTDKLAGMQLDLVIWTTTPWTLPANLAIVIHPRLDYVAVPSPKSDSAYLLVARELAEQFCTAIGVEPDPSTWITIPTDRLSALEGARYSHPFIPEPKADNHFRVWFAEYVTTEQGTGLVHTAPGHGADDYNTGCKHDLEAYAPVDDRGCFTEEVPEWTGQRAFKANPAIVEKLHDLGVLLNQPGESLSHSYPHCWRCKGPVLFRATPQWFAAIDHAELRQRALSEIDNTEWIPPWGKGRIRGMIENRPDWTLSRQRVWGVPIPVFYCKGCGSVRADADIMEHIATLFEEHGSDYWYTADPSSLLPDGAKCDSCGGTDLEPEKDIVDVWFESGTSWLAIAAKNPKLGDVNLYLEGSDQHRGWFHSSLLVGIAVAGKAPYRQVLTHGFVLDEFGHPYSKSAIERARREGKKIKYLPPDEVIQKYGAEILRLWTASTEFRTDIPYSETLLKGLADWYRKFRNTCRFMLGNLSDFDPNAHTLDSATLSELDKYAMARLGDLAARVRGHYDAFEFHAVYRSLVDYVAVDLSALYLDVVKDCLYTESKDSPKRRAVQVVLHAITSTLARLVAPILCFTAEDVWRNLPARGDKAESVHLCDLPQGKAAADDDPLFAIFARIFEYREMTTRALEPFRSEGNRSTDARVVIQPTAEDRANLAGRLDLLAELFIVSDVVLSESDATGDPSVTVEAASGHRCDRCWRWYETMASDVLCKRCDDAVTLARSEAAS